jgi:hypothetical protein
LTGYQRIVVKAPRECHRCIAKLAMKIEENKETLVLRDTRIDEEKKFKRRGAPQAPKDSKDRHKRLPRKPPLWVSELLKNLEFFGTRGMTSQEIHKIMSPKSTQQDSMALYRLRVSGWVFEPCGKVPGAGKKQRNVYRLISCPYVIPVTASV